MTTTIGRLLRGGRFDILAGLAGVILALALLPLQLLATQVFIQTLPMVLGAASVLYLLGTRRNRTGTIATVGTTAAGLLPSISILGMAGLLAVAAFQGGRTLLFYDLAIGVGTAVFAQILFVRDREFSAPLVLAQVVALAAVIRFAAILTTPGYVGIDIWTHVPTWADAIRDSHSLSVIADEKYYASPLYHLLVVTGSLLMAVTLRHALFLTVGIAMPLSILFVYATTKLFADARWATFAAAVFGLSASVIEWGIHLIPTSLGLVFFLAVFYSMVRILHPTYGRRDLALVVFFSVAVILTHQISSFIMLVFTGAGLAAYLLLRFGPFAWSTGQLAIRPRDSVNLTGLLAFDLGLITFMWSLTPYRGGSFLETIASYFRETLVSEAGFLALASEEPEAGTELPPPSLLAEVIGYVDVAGLLLVLFLTVVAGLLVLRREFVSHATLTATVATVGMLIFVFGFPLLGIRTFVPGRWFAFVMAPMAVLGALGGAFLVRNSRPGVVAVVLLVFAMGFPAVSIVASQATQDDPPFPSVQTRYSYTEAELAAVHTIGRYREGSDTDQLATDHPYQTVFERTRAHRSEVAVIDDGRVMNRSVVYRDYQAGGAAFFETPGGVGYTPTVTRSQACSGRRDVTYDNGDVALCTRVTG